MTDWLSEALMIARGGGEAVLITLHATEGSAPRNAGARMLVTAKGQAGSIGGGNLEFLATGQARKLLMQREQAFAFQSYPLGPLLAQCCGGHVGVILERIDGNSVDWLKELERAMRNGRTVYVLSVLHGHGMEKSILRDVKPWPVRNVPVPDDIPVRPFLPHLYDHNGSVLTDRCARRESCAYILEAAGGLRPHIFMFGAGHVGRALAHILRTLPIQVTWIDSRADVFPEDIGSSIRTITAEDPAALVVRAPPGALFLVFTHSHDLDYAITRAILRRRDARYCGLIGSATKRARFEKRFHADGLTADDLAHLTCPIGIPVLTGKEPEVIAIAATAQLMQVIEADNAQVAGRTEP